MQYVNDLIFIFGYGALAFLLTFLFTPPFVSVLKKCGFVKQMREESMDGKKASIFLQFHQHKTGTPNGGGIIIWGSVLLVLLVSRALSYFGIGYYLPFDGTFHSILSKSETYLPLFTLIVTGIFGAVDDYLNVKGKGKQKGMTHKPKFFWLTLFAVAGAWWFHYKLGWSSLHIPRVGDFEIGFWYVPLFALVVMTSAHAVNFTDGLDGLAGGLLAIAFIAFGILAYAMPNPSLDMHHMIFLATFCTVVAGSLVGFLWFNISPARLFMGDTGALSLGATLGVIAMLTNGVFVYLIIGLIFFIELLSSAIQLLSKRYLKRKVLKAAPFHHHLQALGWQEPTIVMRLWILGGMLAMFGVIIGLIGMGNLY